MFHIQLHTLKLIKVERLFFSFAVTFVGKPVPITLSISREAKEVTHTECGEGGREGRTGGAIQSNI